LAPSGSGKTTLLRSLAGLWPYVQGSIDRPSDTQTMFCSQQPYLPLGTLRTALAYPARADSVADDSLRESLRGVQLGHLVDRLDEEADWSRTLSPGEQQRLAFGRIRLARPSLMFLDEATSALDEGMEHAMYDWCASSCPNLRSSASGTGARSKVCTLRSSPCWARVAGKLGRWWVRSPGD
jgi:putative ATP-binding cassette transporter